MKHAALSLTAGVLFAFSFTVAATTFYVDVNNPSPIAPYTNWGAAATSIQNAVDASTAGDEIVVTNGVYQTGGRSVSGSYTTSRVFVDKVVTVRSVNGPAVTVIRGQAAGGGLGPVRCAYLTNGAVLAGFTLANGTTAQHEFGGGVRCASVGALLTNCTLTANSADSGGGAWGGTLDHCALIGNSATATASCTGGGAFASTLNNCTLTGNSAGNGGGAAAGTLNNCTLTGNLALMGGGAFQAKLTNCTLTANSAFTSGGGAYQGTLNNCIVWYNTAPGGSNYSSSSGNNLRYCCTAPLPSGGMGNTNVDPRLVDASHLSTGSPCRGAGNPAYATGADIDGEPWANPPSIGCDEYWSGSVTGELSAAIGAFATDTVPRVALAFTAMPAGPTSASKWDFGAGTVISNRPFASHAWAALGNYPVILTAYNETWPNGVSATVTVHVVEQIVHYASRSNPNPVPPYTTWATAATNIQDAIDAVYTAPKALVLVSNGLYRAGSNRWPPSPGRPTNQVVLVDQPIMVRSVNGPAVTVLEGQQGIGPLQAQWFAVRCAYLTNGCVLSGFTLTNGATSGSGGGVYGAPAYFGPPPGDPVMGNAQVTNCILTGNTAMGDTLNSYGGGACYCTLNNCIVNSNSARWYGGGTYYCTLNDCMVISNSALYSGGGAMGGTLNNCILSGNRTTRSCYRWRWRRSAGGEAEQLRLER